MDLMSIGIILGGIAVFIWGTVAYAAIAFFAPEWVGITGKVARETERSHQEGTEAQDLEL